MGYFTCLVLTAVEVQCMFTVVGLLTLNHTAGETKKFLIVGQVQNSTLSIRLRHKISRLFCWGDILKFETLFIFSFKLASKNDAITSNYP